MSLPTPVDYSHLADTAVKRYHAYLTANPHLAASLKDEPRSAADLGPIDFEKELPEAEDRYLAGNFVDGTWIGKLESEISGEQGSYNVALDPSLRTPYAIIFPTKDYHPQSAPLRPAYLLHAHRLLTALEDLPALKSKGLKVMVVYDCGENSGAKLGHKCVRFYAVTKMKDPCLPFQFYPLPTLSSSLLQTFTTFLDSSNPSRIIPVKPHYNLIMSRTDLLIVYRDDDGFRGDHEGRWDGARLMGVEL